LRKHIPLFLLIAFGLWGTARPAEADFMHRETKKVRLEREAAQSFPTQPKSLYENIYESFLKEDHAAVVEQAGRYLSDARNPHAEDILYLQALSLLKLGRAQEGREKLKALEDAFLAHDGKARAAASIGDSYFYQGDYALARESYRQVLEKYPHYEETPYIQEKLLHMEPAQAPRAALRQVSLEENPFFSVQVGSFAKQRNATALMQKLNYYKYEAYVEEDAAGRFYRVRVGKCATKDEAGQLESRLKKAGYPTKIIS